MVPIHSIRKGFSQRWRDASAGAILGLGSPCGLFLIRFFRAFDGNFPQWFLSEWAAMQWVYLYTGVGTVLAFFLFGFLLGEREDSLWFRTESAEDLASDLERQVITDNLTRVYSRGFILQRLEEELSRARRYNSSLGCLFIDVDGFKLMNDRYGHLFGDGVLESLAKAIAREMRTSDVLGRFGGDEFVAILPETDAEDAFRVAERIRKGVQSTPMHFGGAAAMITISIGIFASSQLPPEASDILDQADSALREAKSSGKNQCVVLCPDRSASHSLRDN